MFDCGRTGKDSRSGLKTDLYKGSLRSTRSGRLALGGELVSGGRARADAEDVGNGPRNRIRVILLERGFVAAAEFHLDGSHMHVQLRFWAAFEMLSGYEANASGE